MTSDKCRSSVSRRRFARLTIGAGAAVVATLATLPAWAQGFPNHAVKIIVPFPAGGSADVVPRVVGEWLSRKWGQPVVIENRVGAAGNIGAEQAYKTEPDGYTLLSSPPPPLVINQNLYPKLGFDPTKFEPIIVVATIPNSLVVTPNFPAKSVAETIAYAKANPGKVNDAIQGNGATSHLTSEMFQMMAGVKFTHIPYTGSAPALNGLVAGNVDIMFDNLGVSLALVKGGKLRLLGVASTKRLPSLPDVPTIAETLPGFESEAFFTIVAPPKTPAQVIEKINADVNAALKSGELDQRFANLSAQVVGGSVKETGAYMQKEVERWKKVIDAAGVKLQ